MLAVVYLVVNKGYGGREDRAAEAIRLDRALGGLMPDEPALGPGPAGRRTATLDRALALGGRAPTWSRARAALHAEEPPDWPQIAALYGELVRLTGSPGVELNRAVAVAVAKRATSRPPSGSERLELDRYHYLHATRARTCCAGSSASKTPAGATTGHSSSFTRDAERRLLERRLAELEEEEG